MIGKIYVLKHPISKEIRYCGQTIKTLEYRLNEHIQDSKRHSYYNANWIKSLLKENLIPEIELIEECTIEELNEREIFYIKYFSQICNLTNVQRGGKEGSFIKHNEQAKQKISNFMKNYKKSKEHIEKMKNSLTKKVYQYNSEGIFIKEFVSVEDLKLEGYKKDTINKACRRKGTAYGYNWRYYKSEYINAKTPYYKSDEFKKKICISNHNRSKKI